MAKAWDVDSGGTLSTNIYAGYNFLTGEDLEDVVGATYGLTNTNGVTTGATGLIDQAVDTGSTNTNKKLHNATFPTFGEGGAWSMSFFVKMNAAPSSGNEAVLVANNSHTAGSTNDVVYCIKYVNDGGTLKVNFARLKEGVAWQDSLYTHTLSTSAWTHLVLTYDGDNVRGYLNGSLVTGPTAYNGAGNNSFGQGIDMFSRGGGSYASCLLDMVYFWNKALSTTEISDLYNGGAGNEYREPPLVTTLTVNVNDAISATESVSMLISDLAISQFEAITVAESVTAQNTELGPISVSEAITVTESVVIDSPIEISVFDSAAVTESLSIDNTDLGGISVSEDVTITEDIVPDNSTLAGISVFESITVEEFTSTDIVLGISVFEDVAVTESVETAMNLGDISVFEGVTVTESVTVLVTAARQGLIRMISKLQEKNLGLDNRDNGKMSSKQQDYPLGMDDKELI